MERYSFVSHGEQVITVPPSLHLTIVYIPQRCPDCQEYTSRFNAWNILFRTTIVDDSWQDVQCTRLKDSAIVEEIWLLYNLLTQDSTRITKGPCTEIHQAHHDKPHPDMHPLNACSPSHSLSLCQCLHSYICMTRAKQLPSFSLWF